MPGRPVRYPDRRPARRSPHDHALRQPARTSIVTRTKEIESEVRSWLTSLSDRGFGRVDFLGGLPAEHAQDLGEPYLRHPGGKVRQLRFRLPRQLTRVTYWLAPSRRVILLTVLRKTRGAETAEVARALRAQMTPRPGTAGSTTYSTEAD